MKKKIIVLLMTITMAASVLAGCGADSSNVADNKKTETSAKSDSTTEEGDLKEDVDATENTADASKEEDSQEINPFLGPDGLMFASEDDVVINISGVDVPMTLKRDELITLIEENNWEIKYDTGNKDRINSFITPDGKVYVNVSDAKSDGSGEELMHIEVLPNQIDFTKVTINGANLEKVEKFKNDSNVVESSESSFKISIADYTTLTANYNNEGEVYIIFITRLPYSLR